LRNTTRLTVAGIIGTVMLTSLAALAGSQSANILLAQDDWVRLPSSGDSSGPTQSSSPESRPAGDHPHIGDNDAPVTIKEFFDFDCPYCLAQEETLRDVVRTHIHQVRLVFMDFPVHRNSMDAALAARCADEQDGYAAYREALIMNPSNRAKPGLERLASALGLDTDSFDTCLEERKYQGAILADQRMAMRAGARGTPFIMVGLRPMDGLQSEPAIESAIEEQLRRQ
jgi:protein-disulfide isomerase